MAEGAMGQKMAKDVTWNDSVNTKGSSIVSGSGSLMLVMQVNSTPTCPPIYIWSTATRRRRRTSALQGVGFGPRCSDLVSCRQCHSQSSVSGGAAQTPEEFD